MGAYLLEERVMEGVQVNGRPPHPVVPPERYRITLDQLQKGVHDSLFEVIARCSPVGDGLADRLLYGQWIVEIAPCSGEPADLLCGQGPYRTPLDRQRLVEGHGNRFWPLQGAVPRLARGVLPGTDVQQTVRMDGVLPQVSIA